MATIPPADAVRTAQVILSGVNGKRLSLDGIWGPASAAALLRAPAEAQQQVKAIVKELNPTVSLEPKAPIAVDDLKVKVLIADLSHRFDVPPESMIAKAKTESGFVPTANNGNYFGLFALNGASWAEGAAMLFSKFGEEIGSFRDSWANPKENTMAAIGYRYELMRQLASHRYILQPDDTDLYLAHQQGAYGYTRLKKMADGLISLTPALEDYRERVRNMRSNVPHDGLGVTIDPRAFVKRWKAITANRVVAAAGDLKLIEQSKQASPMTA